MHHSLGVQDYGCPNSLQYSGNVFQPCYSRIYVWGQVDAIAENWKYTYKKLNNKKL